MSIFDVKRMARELAFPHDEHLSAREVVAERFIETAVEMVNDPFREAALLDNMTDAYEIGYGMIMVDQHLFQLVDQIKTHMKRAGWDPRIRIKAVSKKVGRTFHQMSIQMDLDSTLQIALEEDSAWRLSLEEKERINDVVSDNPDMDQINEFDRAVCRESASQPKVRPSRTSRFVTDDPDGGW